MDSGNSGSLQPSSSNDEEFDSRSDSLQSVFNNNTHFSSLPNNLHNLQNPFLSQQNQLSAMFDPSATYLHPLSQSQPNPYLNAVRSSVGLRSEPEPSSLPGSTSNVSVSSSQPTNVIRNPKKRTRASRRAPTTVLTTDTSNFRQMVQEFTGIPAPPFSGPSYSRRLDLFSTAGSAARSSHLDTLYPLRPLPQKINQNQPLPFTTTPYGFDGGNVTVRPNGFGLNMHNQFQNILEPGFQLGSSSSRSSHGQLNASLTSHVITSEGGTRSNDENQDNLMRSFAENYCNNNSQRLIINASSSLENNNVSTTRGDGGTVDSWICPSD